MNIVKHRIKILENNMVEISSINHINIQRENDSSKVFMKRLKKLSKEERDKLEAGQWPVFGKD